MRLQVNVSLAFKTLSTCMMLLSIIAVRPVESYAATQPAMDASRDVEIRGLVRPSHRVPSILNIYLQVTNNGPEAYLIRGITSPACRSIFGVNFDQDDTEQAAELFTHFTLPSKMTLVFPRGGYHLVCRDFDTRTESQGALTLNFKFLSGGEKSVQLHLKNPPQGSNPQGDDTVRDVGDRSPH